MMPLRTEHEIHTRRRSRNVGLLAALVAFAALVFGLSVVKVTSGQTAALKGYDHQIRSELLPRDPGVELRPATNPVAAPGTPAAGQGARTVP